jgi:hypothetical protein
LAVVDNATTLHITSSEASSFANVASVTLGNSAITFTGPTNGDVSGRKVVVNAITSGTVTGTGTATSWALVDGSVLYATGSLSSSQSVTSGNAFTLAAINIEIRDPA